MCSPAECRAPDTDLPCGQSRLQTHMQPWSQSGQDEIRGEGEGGEGGRGGGGG